MAASQPIEVLAVINDAGYHTELGSFPDIFFQTKDDVTWTWIDAHTGSIKLATTQN